MPTGCSTPNNSICFNGLANDSNCVKPLFLIGYMGCGKSTVGRKLARRLQTDFIDTDTLIEEREGATVSEIFQLAGAEYFRRVERDVLDAVIAAGGAPVVSTGGGMPAWGDNLDRMRDAGITIYLKRSAEQIASRLSPYGRQKRPRLRGLSDAELIDFMRRDMAGREPFYLRAHWTIDCTDRSDNDLIEWIAEHC